MPDNPGCGVVRGFACLSFRNMKEPIDFGLLDRFLSGEATAEERERVVQRAATDGRLRELLDALPPSLRDDDARSWDTERSWTDLATRRAGRLRSPVRLALAIAAMVIVGLGIARTFSELQQRAHQPASQTATLEYRTATGQRQTIPLADGSTVTLAAESLLRVPGSFPRTRALQLEGEAFFEVTHDPARPFTVRARDGFARVLGTSFNLSAYPNDAGIEVVVVTGRVLLGQAERGEGAVLTAGQAGQLGDTGTIRVQSDVDVSQRIAWTEGRLIFRAVRFSEMVRALERWYDVDIDIADAELAEMRVTALLEHQTLDEVVELLAETLGARYTRSGNRIRYSRS
jgi:ferric-dicitrate binding protein FerR (iron transport regulator)